MEEKTTISKNELNDLYNKLQLKDKMIELMAKDFMFYATCPRARNEKGYTKNIEIKALAELSNNEL